MNIFDASIIEFLNKFSHTSESFDVFMTSLADANFVKGVLLASILWFFWFQKSNKIIYNRECVVIAIFSCLVSIAVARTLALSLPFRIRPISNPGINFIKPFGSTALTLENWSSFPSDHATMFFSLATGIFLISKRAGILAYLYILLFICFPRVYLGYHFPTDILAGGVLGILITFIISRNKISVPLNKKVFEFSAKHTGVFYMLTFLLMYEISRMFIEVRIAGSHILEAIHRVI